MKKSKKTTNKQEVTQESVVAKKTETVATKTKTQDDHGGGKPIVPANAADDLKKPMQQEDVVKKSEEDKAFDFYYFVFSLLYMVGFLVHCRKRFNKNVFINGAHILAYITTHQRKYFTDAIFLSFLAWCLYSTYETSPYNANHHNMCGFVSLLLLPQQFRRCYYGGDAKKAGTADALNVLRWAIVIMYFMAGFHKLNTDFLDPRVSCAFDKVNKYFKLFGIKEFDHDMHWIFLSVPYQVLVIEFVPPILLCFQSTQRLALFLLISLHTILLPVNFADFGSIAQSFLFLFMSPMAVINSGLPKHYYLDMAWGFLFFETVTMVMWYQLDSKKVPLKNEEVALVFMAYTMFWGANLRTSNKKHPGPKVYRPKSIISLSALAFFVWFALNPYFGLRTVGCLTMFSNLRTEGPTSNHLLLGSNPWKMFNYQDDIVEAIRMDDRVSNNMGEGEILPRLSFETDVAQKIMRKKWKDVGLTILYNGTIMETEDFLNDPEMEIFRQPHPLWIRKWMDFRFIQKEGPQECTW